MSPQRPEPSTVHPGAEICLVLRGGQAALLIASLVGCVAEPQPAGTADPATGALLDWPGQCAMGVSDPLTAMEQLGRRLFYDVRLSANENRACGTCHEQAKGFTDGFPKAIGTTREVHPRNTLGLTNVAHRRSLTWRDPTATTLEQQLLTPLLGTTPIEMGMGGSEPLLIERLLADELYPELFATAFSDQAKPTVEQVAQAIAAFERKLISASSPVDRYLHGDTAALSPDAQAGLALFAGRAGCMHCHAGCDWDQPLGADGEVEAEPGYFNIGLYNTDGQGSYPPGAAGLADFTHQERDMGRYRTPTLRNVGVTGPYFHDGTEFTLSGAIATHAKGGRNVQVGPNVGDGRESPLRDPRLIATELSQEELWQLEVFLLSLTDDAFLTDPALANPFR